MSDHREGASIPAIALTGNVISAMNPGQRLVVAHGLGEVLGVNGSLAELSLLADGQLADCGTLAESEHKTTLVSGTDVFAFADQHGYLRSSDEVNTYWMSTLDTASGIWSGYYYGHDSRKQQYNDKYPQAPVKLGGETREFVDFSTVYSRLIASEGEPDAWVRGTREMTRFLGLLANEFVKPYKPLDVDLPVVRQPAELARRQNESNLSLIRRSFLRLANGPSGT